MFVNKHFQYHSSLTFFKTGTKASPCRMARLEECQRSEKNSFEHWKSQIWCPKPQGSTTFFSNIDFCLLSLLTFFERVTILLLFERLDLRSVPCSKKYFWGDKNLVRVAKVSGFSSILLKHQQLSVWMIKVTRDNRIFRTPGTGIDVRVNTSARIVR